MSTFIRLLEEEKMSFCAPKLTPLLRTQNRIMRLQLTAMEDVFAAVSAPWPNGPGAGPRKAA